MTYRPGSDAETTLPDGVTTSPRWGGDGFALQDECDGNALWMERMRPRGGACSWES